MAGEVRRSKRAGLLAVTFVLGCAAEPSTGRRDDGVGVLPPQMMGSAGMFGAGASIGGSGAGAGGGMSGLAAGASGAGTGGAPMAAGSGVAGASASAGTSGMIGTSGTPASGAGAGAGTGGSRPMSSGCGQQAQTGAFQAEIMAFDLDRSYFLSVPEDYDPNVAHRLVFGYHGSNYTGMRMRGYLDLEEPPLVERTIFVYPDGLPLTNQPSNVAWELGESGRDIAFFDTLYDHLKSTYCIDEGRVFVNGQSFGGLMTNAVGCLRGDVVRAIAVVAGSGPRASSCREQVAVWITHGMDDMNVAFSSGEASRDRWVAANHCATTTTPGSPAQCQNYDDCDPGFPVIWCPHVNDSGHQHPSFGRAAVREFLSSF